MAKTACGRCFSGSLIIPYLSVGKAVMWHWLRDNCGRSRRRWGSEVERAGWPEVKEDAESPFCTCGRKLHATVASLQRLLQSTYLFTWDGMFGYCVLTVYLDLCASTIRLKKHSAASVHIVEERLVWSKLSESLHSTCILYQWWYHRGFLCPLVLYFGWGVSKKHFKRRWIQTTQGIFTPWRILAQSGFIIGMSPSDF